MELTVNGDKREAPEGTTVSKLLELLTVIPERVVVEVNLTILKRAEHPQIILKEGDQVEIVRFIGGGSRVNALPVTRNQRPKGRSGYWSLATGYSERAKRVREW